MISSKINSCSVGCVILVSLVLLNNNVIVSANAISNVNRLESGGRMYGRDSRIRLSHWRHVRTANVADNNNNSTSGNKEDNNDRAKILDMIEGDGMTGDAISKQRYNDDRLVFDQPIAFRETTTGTTVRPAHSQASPSSLTFEAKDEYNFNVRLSDGTTHGERGDYEQRNGKRVFIIRGYFRRVTAKGDFDITAYVFDHTGYHNIPVESGVTDFRPDEISGGGECDLSSGNYCIDQKLLILMVG